MRVIFEEDKEIILNSIRKEAIVQLVRIKEQIINPGNSLKKQLNKIFSSKSLRDITACIINIENNNTSFVLDRKSIAFSIYDDYLSKISLIDMLINIRSDSSVDMLCLEKLILDCNIQIEFLKESDEQEPVIICKPDGNIIYYITKNDPEVDIVNSPNKYNVAC